jgi:hypothetical protein
MCRKVSQNITDVSHVLTAYIVTALIIALTMAILSSSETSVKFCETVRLQHPTRQVIFILAALRTYTLAYNPNWISFQFLF